MKNSPFKTFFEMRNGVVFPLEGAVPPKPYATWDFMLWESMIAFVDEIALLDET